MIKKVLLLTFLFLAHHSYAMEKNKPCSLEALPEEIRFGEIIKQLINTAQTKKEAWQNINRYQASSKAARLYVIKHKELNE
ncbi:MAG: hypothetical protein ACOYT8_05025 [Candidatus Dependentiae bacterium]